MHTFETPKTPRTRALTPVILPAMPFHVDVEPRSIHLTDSDSDFDDPSDSQSGDDALPVDVVVISTHDLLSFGAAVPESHPKRLSPTGNGFYGKVLVPAYHAGAMIGKKGRHLAEIKVSSGMSMSMSSTDVLFPGTPDRMLSMHSDTRGAFIRGVDAIVRLMWRICRAPGHVAPGSNFVFKLAVPNSSVGRIIGEGGSRTREIHNTTGCHVGISPRNKGIQERVVVVLADSDFSAVRGVMAVLDSIQEDPHIHEHMGFTYDVKLPLGCWDCGKPGPADPYARLMLSRRVGNL